MSKNVRGVFLIRVGDSVLQEVLREEIVRVAALAMVLIMTLTIVAGVVSAGVRLEY